MDGLDAHDAGAAQMLRHIERGGHHLLMVARRRVASFLDRLDQGDFRGALAEMDGARSCVVPLAQAQSHMAIASTADLIMVKHLQPGMVLSEVGEITAVEHEGDCGGSGCGGHVMLMIGEQPLRLDADAEVFVEPVA